MQRAGQKRSASVRANPATRPAATLQAIAVADAHVAEGLLPEAEGTARDRLANDAGDAIRQALEIAVLQRIESRLPGRIRNLLVRVVENVVILEGQCATYYTKQLAQHTAMGIIEDEQLENAIVVSVPR